MSRKKQSPSFRSWIRRPAVTGFLRIVVVICPILGYTQFGCNIDSIPDISRFWMENIISRGGSLAIPLRSAAKDNALPGKDAAVSPAK